MTYIIVVFIVFVFGGAVYMAYPAPASKFERQDNERRKANRGL